MRTIAAATTTPVSYLSRCLGLLECPSNVPDDGLTLSQLEGRSGTPVSTASRLVRVVADVGDVIPPHRSAMGKAEQTQILSHVPATEPLL